MVEIKYMSDAVGKRIACGVFAFKGHMTDTTYILDNFVATKPGEPYRLLPFGTIKKGGKVRDITPELAAKFKLPPFKPPIKLGSHEEATPAGGHMLRLEVREDGLYVMPEFNAKGEQAMADGAYRYHSPEIIWEDGGLVTNDGIINGPLIVGDALVHDPYLGESTAFYTTETIQEETMSEENITLPKSFYDKFIAPLFTVQPEKVEVIKTVEPDDYAVVKLENEQYKAQLEAQKQADERKARVDKFSAALKETKADAALNELLADLPDEAAEKILQQFKALSAQIDEAKLTGERGSDGGGAEGSGDPKAAFNAAVLSLSQTKNINYNAAFQEVKDSQPDLFKAAFKK